MAEPFFSFHTIGDGSPYMTRLLVGRLRLHIFHRGDGDPDPHDHPWSFWTFPLTSYVEEVTEVDGIDPARWVPYRRRRVVRSWRLHHRASTHTHRVLGRWAGRDFNFDAGRIVTFVWRGKGGRRWGFLKTRDGRTCWQHWKEYVLRGGKHAPCEPAE